MSVPARLAPTDPIQVLRDQIAPDASDAELVHFSQVCARLDLSPFKDQIVLVGRWSGKAQRLVHRHQITVAGRRTLAMRTGLCTGIDGPMWAGPRADRSKEHDWLEVWEGDAEHPPYVARTLVHVKDWVVPAKGVAPWNEFAQYDSNGNLIPTWRQMPAHMIGKVSESMALRRAFPDVIEAAIATDYPIAGVDVEADVAVLAEAAASVEPAPAQVLERPPIGDQAAAHRIIAELPDDERERFVAEWRIDDFGALWPADVVADALGRRP